MSIAEHRKKGKFRGRGNEFSIEPTGTNFNESGTQKRGQRLKCGFESYIYTYKTNWSQEKYV